MKKNGLLDGLNVRENMLFLYSKEEVTKRYDRYMKKKRKECIWIVVATIVLGVCAYAAKKDITLSLKLVCLGIIGCLGVYIGKDSELANAAKKRKEEMILDYPKIIQRYALYYRAGMSSKKIWKSICEDYLRQQKRGSKKRVVYEAMLETYKAMEDGMGEIQAYLAFAERLRMPQYRKFVSLVTQLLSQGGDRALDHLLSLAKQAGSERQNTARILGEAAGVKLLFPMFLMLLCVIGIVMIPALFSFSGVAS